MSLEENINLLLGSSAPFPELFGMSVKGVSKIPQGIYINMIGVADRQLGVVASGAMAAMAAMLSSLFSEGKVLFLDKGEVFLLSGREKNITVKKITKEDVIDVITNTLEQQKETQNVGSGKGQG